MTKILPQSEYFQNVPTKLFQPHLSTPNEDAITKQILPIFRLLRIVGRCPFSFEMDSVSIPDNPCRLNTVQYTFKKSTSHKGFMMGISSAILIIAVVVVASCAHNPMGFIIFQPGYLWPESTPTSRNSEMLNGEKECYVPSLVLLSYETIYNIVVILEYVIVWGTCPFLLKWINEWNNIEMDLRSCPGGTKNFKLNLSKFLYSLMIFYILLPTLVFGTVLFQNEFRISYPFYTAISLFYCFISTLCIHSEDVKTFMIFQTIAVSIKEVRHSMKNFCKDILTPTSTSLNTGTSVGYKLTKSEINTWMKITIKLRKQAELAGRYLTIHQLFSIAVLIYFASSALFTVLFIIIHECKKEWMLTVCVFTVISVPRLLLNIMMAVRITEEGKKLAALVKDIELAEQDPDLCMVLKAFYEMMTSRPMEISLSNYVTLNNGLVLTITGQVLTQFIVFMQIQSS